MLKQMYKAVTPKPLQKRIRRVRKAWDPATPMILKPTYAEDGLISAHVCDFLTDKRFKDAYRLGRQDVDWSHPSEIQFRAYTACWAAEHALRVPGDFVECGVAHGVLSRTICSYVSFEHVDKTFYLYDTFQGIPVDTLSDERERKYAEKFNQSHYAQDLLPLVTERFKGYPNVRPIPGIIPGSFQVAAPDRISYLSIDMNNAVAEIAAIEFLWDRLSPGAVILLDDYANSPEYATQRHAWNAFANEQNASILTLPTGQGLIIKKNEM